MILECNPGWCKRFMVFPTNVQTDCRATQPLIQKLPRAHSLGIKWLGHETDSSPPSKSVAHVIQMESNASLFSYITSFFRMHGWLMPIQLLCVMSYLTRHSAVIMAVEAHMRNIGVTGFLPECVWHPVMWAASQLLYVCKCMISVMYLCYP